MNGRRTLILADDHALVRAGIRALLAGLPNVEVVAEAGDGLAVLELVRRHPVDAVLLDITLPGLNGLEVARQISAMGGNTRILMLSMHAGPEYVARALAAGASGYLVKDAAFEELATALEVLWSGRRYLGKAIDPLMVEQFLANQQAEQPELAVLTPRQRQILQLIAEGYGTRDIAARLSLSIKTVETHRSQLMDRLRIYDVPGLVRLAIRQGLVTPES
jgi:DNA-binding NarL/FixJ family response regulator